VRDHRKTQGATHEASGARVRARCAAYFVRGSLCLIPRRRVTYALLADKSRRRRRRHRNSHRGRSRRTGWTGRPIGGGGAPAAGRRRNRQGKHDQKKSHLISLPGRARQSKVRPARRRNSHTSGRPCLARAFALTATHGATGSLRFLVVPHKGMTIGVPLATHGRAFLAFFPRFRHDFQGRSEWGKGVAGAACRDCAADADRSVRMKGGDVDRCSQFGIPWGDGRFADSRRARNARGRRRRIRNFDSWRTAARPLLPWSPFFNAKSPPTRRSTPKTGQSVNRDLSLSGGLAVGDLVRSTHTHPIPAFAPRLDAEHLSGMRT
jgi:hypothetical protein